MNLHYNISGEGECIVFIHGGYVNSEIWHYQSVYFRQHYKVLTFDMRGHGRSDPSDLDEYSVATFGEDLIRLLDKLGIHECTLCGLSLGAMIAQYVAATHPERVKGLILTGTTASLRLGILEKIVTTVIFPKWVAMGIFGSLSTKQFLKLSFLLTWFMRGSKWLGNDETRSLIRRSIAMIKRHEVKKIYAAVHTFRKQNLNNGDYPVLLINGQYDSPLIHHHAKYLRKSVGNRGELHTIPLSGHACNHDKPLVFNEILEQWFLRNSILPEYGEAPIETGYTSGYTRSRVLHRAS